jgi:diamine N-acetyltransferase
MTPRRRKNKPTRDSIVSLREITSETVETICDLEVRPDQDDFVASNAESIAEAHFAEHAWFRAIYADRTPVGFVLLQEPPGQPVYLWRFMIDARYQGCGFGKRAMQRILDRVRSLPAVTCLRTSVVPGPGGPQPFYESLGFVPTGEIDDDEIVLQLDLGSGTSGESASP